MTLDVTRNVVGRTDSISDGSTSANIEAWDLRFSTHDGEQIVIRLDPADMYELWTEVRGVPWPTVHRDPERR
ncbi:hypothetical protein Hbl1158_07045 [Halobaculum sp. CBA1158]|uniref:hypothetical protein n=1 Tax=Halobaculum sp. CBA1158 TaxID=2904243 RepID=UPI001F28355E|nr:hypothetical protein [Halobaculum sp. CBA1158]UIP01098.1 hypothetical protein Hbl1158_07045 [Halobaculum sp. CBA1158]